MKIKILRVIVIILSSITVLGYFLVTADVPPVVALNELYALMAAHLIIVLLTFLDFAVCIKHKYRGGIFTLCFEVILLLIWIQCYKGNAFHAANGTGDYAGLWISFGGIISCSIQIASQLINLVHSYVKKKNF